MIVKSKLCSHVLDLDFPQVFHELAHGSFTFTNNCQFCYTTDELLASFDLVQTVSGPTHCAGNTLDVVITRRDCQPTDCDVQPPGVISDHGLIVCQFASAPFAAKRVITELRPWKKLDLEAFTASLRSSALCDDVSKLRQLTADEMFALYDGTLRSIVDKHVPAYKAAVREHHPSPWFDDECRASRRRSRMLERRYQRTLRADDRLAWIRQVRFEKKEELYWTSRITPCSGNSRRLWKSMSSLLRWDKSTATKPSSGITADKLAQIFAEKVAAVRSETKDAPSSTFTQHSGTQLSSFSEVSAVDVQRVLTSSPAKTCTLDPLPTSVLLDVLTG